MRAARGFGTYARGHGGCVIFRHHEPRDVDAPHSDAGVMFAAGSFIQHFNAVILRAAVVYGGLS